MVSTTEYCHLSGRTEAECRLPLPETAGAAGVLVLDRIQDLLAAVLVVTLQ